MMKFYFAALWAIIVSNLSAQRLLSTSELEKQPTFYSLEKAVANKDKVYKLNLSKQKLEEFPMEILLFQNLQVLILANNQITEIPKEINQLQNLQVLHLAKNKIKKLPETIGDLKNLHTLYLSRNRLIYFPNEMRGLDNLLLLDVSRNHLTYDEIAFIKKILPDKCELHYK